jgi:arylamine N-acetyltransferase
MASHPLDPPRDQQLLRTFLNHTGRLGLDWATPEQRLCDCVSAFARLPYENLTKIIKGTEMGLASRARRTPDEVVSDHVRLGTGGTCFSLTATLVSLLRALGWQTEVILADRRYGPNTHCALLVWIKGHPHLVDPGYLIVEPIRLHADEQRITTAFNQLRLIPRRDRDQLELWTEQGGDAKYRLSYRTHPADPGEFLEAWDASFDWDMMQYPLLTRVTGDHQRYLRGNRLQVRGHGHIDREEIAPDQLIDRIVAEFGIARPVAVRGLALLQRRRRV